MTFGAHFDGDGNFRGSPEPSAILDSPSSQLPPSTFAPPPVDTPALDYLVLYGPLLAELDRLEELAVTLRMRLRLRAIAARASVLSA